MFDRLACLGRPRRLRSRRRRTRPDADEAEEEPAAEGAVASEAASRPAGSAQAGAALGIETAAVDEERHAHRLTCNAETAYDGRHMAEVLSRVSGVLREVRVDLGQVVHRGDVLAVVESAQVGTAKVQYHTAREAVALAQATYDRTVRLTQAKAAPAKTELENRTALNQARANLMDAEQKLRNLGFSDADLARIAKANDTSNLLEIVAPIDGSIIAWDATPGRGGRADHAALRPGRHDATMWLWIDVYESDIAVGRGRARR